jgi:hypothetical protein
MYIPNHLGQGEEAYLLVILQDNSSFEAALMFVSWMRQEPPNMYHPQVYY